MKILITHPFCWPYVRRGSERFLDELSRYLVTRGHEVTVLTSKPVGDQDEISREHGVLFVRKPQIRSRIARWMGIPPEKSFAAQCVPFMLKNRFDVIHCLYFYDACAASLASLLNKNRYVIHITGIPILRHFLRRPLDYAVLLLGLARAFRIIVPSRLAQENLSEQFHYLGNLIPPPCDITRFSLKVGRELERPRILAVGAFGERRKGARVLLSAFLLLKNRVPGAVLQYSGHTPSNLREELLAMVKPEMRSDIEFLGVGQIDDLPKLYAKASVTVLPSLFDVFGMVLLESLACGTPVVGTRHGGLPEIIEDGVGSLFDPGTTEVEATNAEGLSNAILSVLRSYQDPDLPFRCRSRAETFGWNIVGPCYEQVYTEQEA
jgi:phosphatidylinositol alpha-mannosyltransferase